MKASSAPLPAPANPETDQAPLLAAPYRIPRVQDIVLPSIPEVPEQILNIGVSTSALFDTREEDAFFRECYAAFPNDSFRAERTYMQAMRELELVPFKPGPVLPFIKKMLGFNKPSCIFTNFTILSRNNPRVSARVHRSLHEHGLYMKAGKERIRFGMGEAYMKGRPITPRLLCNFGVDLFLSPNGEDVKTALQAGIPAGQAFHSTLESPPTYASSNLLLAFDFDRVLGLAKGEPDDKFQDDSEEFFKQKGLLEYWKREARLTTVPAHPGPLAPIYFRFVQLRNAVRASGCKQKLELAFVSARSSDPFARIQTTIDHWGGPELEEDYRISSRRTPKRDHLKELEADIFFDDSLKHVELARDVTAAILVPHVNQTCAPKPPAPQIG